MREILFRGKRMDNGEWVEAASILRTVDGAALEMYIGSRADAVVAVDDDGNIHQMSAGPHVLYYRVDPDTVGQFTGLTDKNGRKVFEGDILKTHYANAVKCNFVETVVFRNGRFCAEGRISVTGRSWAGLWDGAPHAPQDCSVYMDDMEVIGNIHDDPELPNQLFT